MRRWWNVPILAYHRVGEPKDDHVPTVTPEAFERQLQFLSRRSYRVWSLSQLVEVLSQDASPPPHTVVITFDDGYEETYSVAAPLLHRFGFGATVFVTPMEIGLPGFMTWDHVRMIAQNGFLIGSHTLHHSYLPLLSEAQLEEELVQSKAVLERELGHAVDWLSYPIGGFTPTVQVVARTAGYRAACTTNRGCAKTNNDLFALRRIKITEQDQHPLLLRVKLSGYYDCFRRLERPT